MAWKDVTPDLQKKLYEIRSTVGTSRQPDLTDEFNRLKKFADDSKVNPFDSLKGEMYTRLGEECQSFKKGAHWTDGNFAEKSYFYRIETLGSFLGKHTQFLQNDFTQDIIEINLSESRESIFSRFIQEYEKRISWIKLERLISQYYCYREFSWWTDQFNFDSDGEFPTSFIGANLTIANKWLIAFAFKAGISSDWLSDNMLFLRLDSSKMKKEDIKVPSIIDAFVQPIFSPRTLQENKHWGLAFDLKDEVQPFNREYVLKNIPIDSIEFIPVKINADKEIDKVFSSKARINDPLVEKLIEKI